MSISNMMYALQMFTLHPLTIVLPSREDKDQQAVDLDLHLPFFCFRPQQLLQVLKHTHTHFYFFPGRFVGKGRGSFHFTHFCLFSLSAGALLPPAGAAGGAIFC